MSGILAILRTDGAPVDAALVRSLTNSSSLRLRGPDAQATWCDGPVALGHTLLRTTYEAAHERQPFSLDRRVRIVADARVDARAELIQKLGKDSFVPPACPDVELILRAYHRWGPECVQHLIGDFAFVIWDEPKRQLFCARDHMGVKPFYYAHLGRWLVVSSTIEALRFHPDVSEELNDLAIADFLLVGFNQDAATTSFHDIQRLPPAHTLTSSMQGLSVQRYWTLPIEKPVYYQRDRDYVDRFKELVRQAVVDRLRTDRVGVFMSGGLDSSMLAATANDVLGDGSRRLPVHAFTFVYDSLIPDQERKYAGIVAEHLGIPIRYYAKDERPGWYPSVAAEFPEPHYALTDREPALRCHSDMAAHSRVAFYGEGPDNALRYEWKPHLVYLFRQRRLVRLVVDIGKHLAAHKRLPLLPTIPRILRERRELERRAPGFPAWLSPDLVKRLNLEERWRVLNDELRSAHPTRPEGHASILTAQWQSLFETSEPAYTQASLEVRHPYVDIRVLRFMLGVPAMPWCRAKHLLRRAMIGVVPEDIRRRSKQGLAGDPLFEQSCRFGLPPLASSPIASFYGTAESLPNASSCTVGAVHAPLRFAALSHWLSFVGSPRNFGLHKDQDYGIAQATVGV